MRRETSCTTVSTTVWRWELPITKSRASFSISQWSTLKSGRWFCIPSRTLAVLILVHCLHVVSSYLGNTMLMIERGWPRSNWPLNFLRKRLQGKINVVVRMLRPAKKVWSGSLFQEWLQGTVEEMENASWLGQVFTDSVRLTLSWENNDVIWFPRLTCKIAQCRKLCAYLRSFCTPSYRHEDSCSHI